MRARFALVAFATAFLLTGCDLAGSNDSVSGYWEGTSEFKADTVLAAHNARITADYRMHFAFDLTHDDGLVTGRITATREGYMVYREAGFPADTIRFAEGVVTNNDDAYGTFIEPDLEVDVPTGPYEEGMWTFDVVGSTAETANFIQHKWSFTRNLDEEIFDHTLRSDETFRMKRVDRPADAGEVETLSGDYEGELVRAALRSLAAERVQRSEQ